MGILDSSFFGGGQYDVKDYNIDKNAYYNDPNKENNLKAQNLGQIAQNRQAPSIANVTIGNANTAAPTSVNNQFRQGQEGLIGNLTAQANGTGPSLAASQLGQANAAAAASRMATAASERGYGGGASTNRQLAYQQGAANQANAIAAAQMRNQEQIQAREQLAGVLQNARGQDFGEAQLAQNQSQFNTAAQNQFSLAQGDIATKLALADQEAKLRQMGMNDEQIRAMLSLSSNLNAQNQQNQMAYNQLGVQQNSDMQRLKLQAYQDERAGKQMFVNQLLGAAQMGLGNLSQQTMLNGNKNNTTMSDENSKEVESKFQANKDMQEFLDNLSNSKYKYKESVLNLNGAGEKNKMYYSPMAQELEKSKVGKSMVSDGEDGFKRVDYARGLGAILSSLSLINNRIKKIEKKGK